MEKELPAYVSIKHWAEDDKPREKLEANGARVLSDAELMAILSRSGSASFTNNGINDQLFSFAIF